MKCGDERIAFRIGCTVEEANLAKQWIKKGMNQEVENTLNNKNVSKIKEFDEHLEKLGLTEKDVKSVKFWQTQGGETRYSIVTNNDTNELPNLEEIKNYLSKTIIPISIPEVERSNDKILVVFTSDKHIGALTKPEAMFDNTYNAWEFNGRMENLFMELEDVNFKEGILNKIVVVDLGDAMDGYDGETTRGGHKLPQNMSNKESFEVFLTAHKIFYNALVGSGFAKEYEIYHISNSNHGGEFEHFATRCLQEYLRASYSNLKVEVLDKFITPVTIGNHTYLLSHGKDTEDLKNGLPLTLDAKTEQYIINYVLYHKLSTDNLHFIKGDLHQASTQWGKNFRYRNVPSIYGSSKWIMTNFGYSKPGCSFDLLEGDSVKQWEIWF